MFYLLNEQGMLKWGMETLLSIIERSERGEYVGGGKLTKTGEPGVYLLSASQ